jgi:hypothetical protein
VGWRVDEGREEKELYKLETVELYALTRYTDRWPVCR